jgi:hypothetical protein
MRLSELAAKRLLAASITFALVAAILSCGSGDALISHPRR